MSKAISGKKMREDIPSQIYSDRQGRPRKFSPGEFVTEDLIKKYRIDPKYFIHPGSLYNQGAFEFAHEKKGKFSVAIIRDMNGRGDVLMSSVIAKALKYKYGDDVEVWFVVQKGYERILQHNPWVDRVYTDRATMEKAVPDIKLDVNNLEFRVEVKDFERDGRVVKNRASIYLEQMGLFIENKTPTYIVTQEEREWVREWLKENGHDPERPLIGMELHGSNVSRTYPHIKELLHMFPEDGPQFVILDSKVGDKYEFDMAQLGALVEQCDVVVAPNSYVLHLAGALKKRAVVVFGSVDGKVWVEDYEKTLAIEADCPVGERHKCWWTLKCLPGKTMQEKEVTKAPACLDIDPNVVKDALVHQLTEPKKVLVSVLTYNFLDLTQQCIDSVRSFHDYDIFVVDNESEDGTQEWLEEQGVDYVSRATPVPEAWNMGMKKAWAEEYDYVLLCNNDIILSPTYIDHVVEVIERRKCGAVTGRVINQHESSQESFHGMTKGIEIPVQIMQAGDYSALLMSMDCIRDVGKFRSLAPRYQSDEDHLLRMRLLNVDLIKTWGTTFYHKHGAVWKGMSTQMQDKEWKKGIHAFKKIWNIDPYEERTQLHSLEQVKKRNPDWQDKVREPWAKS
jgi:ADP-heptose:LPS heptosyltransferase